MLIVIDKDSEQLVVNNDGCMVTKYDVVSSSCEHGEILEVEIPALKCATPHGRDRRNEVK